MVSAGNLGMIKASKKYDVNNPTRAKFSTYAYYFIRKEMQETQFKSKELIRIPALKRKKV